MRPNLVICEKYLCILIISTKWPKIKYKKNSYLRKLPTDFRNLFFVLFLKSRRTSTNKNLTHFVHLKISYGQATTRFICRHVPNSHVIYSLHFFSATFIFYKKVLIFYAVEVLDLGDNVQQGIHVNIFIFVLYKDAFLLCLRNLLLF